MSEEAKEPGQESAFPNQYYNGGELWCEEKGLTKREFIAMNILAGWANDCTDANKPRHYEYAAKSSVQLADALLKELANE